MRFTFNDRKTAQAAAYLLKEHGAAMPYLVLVKLLYLADRRMLIEQGQPITGDRPFSMRHGPVLSQVLDLLTEGPGYAPGAPDSQWYEYVTAPFNYDVALRREAPTDELSRYELRLLREVHAEYGRMDKWELVERMHRELPEWKDPGGSAWRIEFEEILRAGELSEEQIAETARDADELWRIDRFAS